MSKEYNQILKDIESKNTKSIYALDGEEPFYIDKLCDAFENKILTEAEKDFNLTILYGKDTDWSTVVTACRRYPMFAQKQIVILKEAQYLKDFGNLEVYLENPLSSTIFVIAYKYKKLDARLKATKLIKTKGVHYTSELVKDYKLADWILDYANSIQVKINIATANLLANYLGTDLQKIANEIDKVLINIPGAKEITPEHVEKYIGISIEYDVFQLPKMVMQKNVDKTFKMIHYFVANPKVAPMVLVMASFYSQFSKLYAYHFVKNMPDKEAATAIKVNPYFLKDYKTFAQNFNLQKTETVLKMIYDYNIKSLGVESIAKDTSLLKEFVAKVIYM